MELAEPVRAGLEGWLGVDVGGWSTAALPGRGVELVEGADRFEAALVACLGVFDGRQGWALDGDLSAVAWLVRTTGMGRGRAQGLVQVARLVAGHESWGDALSAGEVTVEEVRAFALVRTPARAGLFDRFADQLLDSARSLDVGDCRTLAQHWAAIADDQLNDPCDEVRRHERRRFHVGPPVDGVAAVDGLLEAAGQAVVQAALAQFDGPDAANCPGGVRTLPQRQCDAFVEVCRRSLSATAGRRDPAAGITIVIDHALLMPDLLTPQQQGSPPPVTAELNDAHTP